MKSRTKNCAALAVLKSLIASGVRRVSIKLEEVTKKVVSFIGALLQV